MKHLYTTLIIAVLIMISACSSDDGEIPIVLTTVSDIEVTVIPQVIMVGDTLAEIPGTSSRGNVTFTIVSQTINAFDIRENSGQLIVSNAGFIMQNENSVVQVVVSITSEEVTENTNVAVTILPICPDVDLLSFIDALSVTNSESIDIIEASGSFGRQCNSILTIIGGDPFGLAECFDSALDIIFLRGDGNTGQVLLQRQDYCTEGVEIDGTGTYNLQNRTITIDINRTEDGVTNPSGTVTINCNSTVDTSIWEGDLNYEETVIGLSSTGTGSAGCNSLRLMGDIGFFECEPDFVPVVNYTLTPISSGATSGTINAERQRYSCFDGSVESIFYLATGTYDEITGEIELNYEFFQNGTLILNGTTLVKTAN